MLMNVNVYRHNDDDRDYPTCYKPVGAYWYYTNIHGFNRFNILDMLPIFNVYVSVDNTISMRFMLLEVINRYTL